MHWQIAAVTQTSITSNIYQAPDVHLHLTPQITLDLILAVNNLAQGSNVRFRQVLDLHIDIHSGLAQNLIAQTAPNAIDVRQTDFYSLVPWQVHPCNTRHTFPPAICSLLLSLALLVLWVLANHPYHTTSPDNLALWTTLLY